jgi:polynucleotide 5'-hydroxyl-kinase GRC3/NOL9
MAMKDLPWDIPSSWRPALDAAGRGGVIFLIGEIDSGKSTLAAVLANEAMAAGRRAAIVDADVGQSSIGPPACVGLAMPRQQFSSLDDLAADAIDFVGACSPAGHLLQAAAGTAALANSARAAGCETIIIDTTGMVSGGLARALKVAKIRLVDPEAVVALQHEDELDHLVAPYRSRTRPRVLRLSTSRAVQARSREERTANRQRKFAAYLKGARLIEAPWRDAPVENSPWTNGERMPGHMLAYCEERLACEVVYGERRADGIVLIVRGRAEPEGLLALRDAFGGTPHVIEAGSLENLAVGLLGEKGETLAMGILERVDFRAQRLFVYTPLAGAGQVRGIRLGSLRISRDGNQLAAAL